VCNEHRRSFSRRTTTLDELNEFRRHLRTLGPVQRRILSVLMPQLVALDEAGDADGALSIIEEVKTILWEGRRTRH
jgi:glutamine synthetase adenylyltransferase